MIVAGSPPNSGSRDDIFSRCIGATSCEEEEESSCRPGTLRRVGSFGLTHVPVARAVSLHPSRCHFVPRTTPPRELAFRKQKRTWANFSKDILTDSVFSLSLSLVLSFFLSCVDHAVLFLPPLSNFFSFFPFLHSSPVLLLERFDLTTRIELEFTMLFRHRVPTRRRSRLDTTRRRIDDTAPSFLAALNDSASSEIPLRAGRTWV